LHSLERLVQMVSLLHQLALVPMGR